MVRLLPQSFLYCRSVSPAWGHKGQGCKLMQFCFFLHNKSCSWCRRSRKSGSIQAENHHAKWQGIYRSNFATLV